MSTIPKSRRINHLLPNNTMSPLEGGLIQKTNISHSEGNTPLSPEEETGELLPDNIHHRRKLPDLLPNSINIQETKEKYKLERQKRLDARSKNDSNTSTDPATSSLAGRTLQYPRVADLAKIDSRFEKMISDPFSGPGNNNQQQQPRKPLNDEVQIAIIGAGYGGLLAGARLREQGILAKDIRLFDRSSDVGGTWYWNRYPGAMCDVESYIYMPLCEELNYVPSEKYAHQPEMLRHSQHIAHHYGLYDNACLSTDVEQLKWNDTLQRWMIKTDKGDSIQAKYIICNFGVFSHPKLPGVPGVETFQGKMMHTSRWDYEYTGGSSNQPMSNLSNKRVAIIGTGATAVQVVPHLATSAQKLFVFQRTPSTIDVRNNHKTSLKYAKTHLSKKNWQRNRAMNFVENTDGIIRDDLIDLVNDGWTANGVRVTKIRNQMKKETQRTGITMNTSERREMIELQDYEHVERIRKRTDAVVKDPTTADALKPWYRLFCKRPCFHDDYLDSFNRNSVKLIDTNGVGVQKITKQGVVANGIEYPVDVIVYATGFETSWTIPMFVDPALVQRKTKAQGFEIIGKNNITLSDYWGKEGPKTNLSVQTKHFPNAFWLNGPQGVITNCATTTLDEVSRYIASIVSKMIREQKKTCEIKEEIQNAYCQTVYESSLVARKFYASCTPGYYSNEGSVDVTTKSFAATYPGGSPGQGGVPKFFQKLTELQESGDLFQTMDVV